MKPELYGSFGNGKLLVYSECWKVWLPLLLHCAVLW